MVVVYTHYVINNIRSTVDVRSTVVVVVVSRYFSFKLEEEEEEDESDVYDMCLLD